jgi:deoxyribodipyrimidine photo-lyase
VLFRSHFGEISPRLLWQALQPLLAGEQGAGGRTAAEAFLRQLGWREFARELLCAFPHTDRQPLDPRYGDGFWGADPQALRAWQRGETGVALVDAGMRELWATGWMHNRVRMVAASLLTKNLGVDWRAGARWFWDTLVDADLANNSLGWQWVAGCGADAAPYYRIFNPDTQADRFDAAGSYRRRWLRGNPRPAALVDLAASRQAALDRYRQRMAGG